MAKLLKVGIWCAGRLEVHATDPTGNYATLCGMDGDDPDDAVQQSPAAAKVTKNDHINCKQCYTIWRHAQQYCAKDFQ